MSIRSSTKPCVFIISSFVEPNVDAVIRRLEKRNVRWVRFNTETLPLLTRISLDVPSSAPASARFSLQEEEVDTREITSVWYRRSGSLILPEGLSPKQQEFIRSEAISLLLCAYDCIDCPWVNPRRLEGKAGLKPYQATAAKAVGLMVPETIVTNDPDTVRAFAEKFPGQVLFKPVGGMVGGTPPEFAHQVKEAYGDKFALTPDIKPADAPSDNPFRAVFSQMLTPDKMEHIDSIVGCPAIFQEYIPKQIELRITIIGDEVFAAEIHSQTSEETKVDFRRMSIFGRKQIPKHAVHKLPDDIRDKLLEMMKRLGLVFGCADMIVTPDGRYVFLEVNPSGQWQWVEELTGMPITDALTDYLVRTS